MKQLPLHYNEKRRKSFWRQRSAESLLRNVIKALRCVVLLSPLFLAEVGSWWAGRRRSQLGNLLSDWFVRWHRVPNQSWGPARRCPGPTGSGLPSGSSGTWTPPPLWGKKQNPVCTEVRRLTETSTLIVFMVTLSVLRYSGKVIK